MKPIHLISSKDRLRPAMGYIQIKKGFAYATDGFCAVKIPVADLFGNGVVSETEEFYIHSKLWVNAKFHTAISIYRDGLTFKTDKGLEIKAVFQIDCGRFPDVDQILPDIDKIEGVQRIGIDTQILKKVSDVIDKHFPAKLTFFGELKGILINSTDHQNKCLGIVMPCGLK